MKSFCTLFALVLMLVAPAGAREDEPLVVFAAASLANVLDELSQEYRKTTGVAVKFSFAASSLLARQIEVGGRADVFVSADVQWMDYLAERGLIDRATRRDVAGNRLVIVAPSGSQTALEIRAGLALAAALGDGRLAVADPDTVPAGRYARAALESLGAWATVERRLARADNVRAALLFVARGETPLGIVYSTDAQIEPKVRVVATFPDHSHPPIAYPAAASASAGPRAVAFLAYLSGAEAAPIWKKYGFLVPAGRSK